jgi:asparagine synthase (glutamine-hydrolysing)
MRDRLAHRGPDDSGVWSDPEAGVCLGFRRLSIIDLSAAGHQPMASATGRYEIVFNGEIYNFESLRRQLQDDGASFRGHSDTEVILAALERWGVSAAIPRLSGMFALGIWDRQQRQLSLVRDRIGKKPLYYAVTDGSLCFASEMKAFLALAGFDRAIDEGGLRQFLAYGYTQHPLTIYRDVRQVAPGEMLHFQNGVQSGRETFWRVPFPSPDLIEGSHEALIGVLEQAVRERLVADVPLGLFLSAGIDSSVVAALAQRCSVKPIRSFTIGFREDEQDESRYSEQIAKRIGTDHTTIYLSQRDALDLVPQLPHLFDSPFGDSSALPTLLVCRAARKEVTVALSGDGGDEVFGGYHNYVVAPQLWKKMNSMPGAARQLLARFSGGRSVSKALHAASRVVSLKTDRQVTPLRIREAGRGLKHKTFASFYTDFFLRIWKDPGMLLGGSDRLTPSILPQGLGEYAGMDEREIMMAIDLECYLPSDVLVKVDRASMWNSLEVRSPLLDTRVIETARRLPLAQRTKKQILREIAYDLVGRDLLDRPKQGFSVPLGTWLRSELRPWAEDLLDPKKIDPRLHAPTLHEVWQEHLSGKIDNSFRLWNLLSYEAWRRQ